MRAGHLIALAIALACAASPAHADPSVRRGAVLGVAIGAGGVVTADCTGSCDPARRFLRLAAPNLKLGWLLAPRAAILLYVPTGLHRRDGDLRAFESVAPAVQLWPRPETWVLAALGPGFDFPAIGSATTGFHVGAAATLVAGHRIARLAGWDVELQARAMGGLIDVGDATRRAGALDLLIGLTRNGRAP